VTACSRTCRTATGPVCRCPACGGENHGAEAAAQQLTLLALSPTAPVTAPEPVETPEEPQKRPAPAVPPLNGHRKPRRRLGWEEGRCDGCGKPFAEVVLFGTVEIVRDGKPLDARLCTGCLDALWAEQARAERAEAGRRAS
jgi:hypothetical protein